MTGIDVGETVGMLRLILMRHAKSAWDDPLLADFDRGLNERGLAAAPQMARYLVEDLGLEPDRILCSTARRTRETLAGCLPFFRREQDILLLDRIYHASEESYVDLIRQNGGTAQTLMLIGHNPAIQNTALDLTEQASAATLHDVREKYPTASIAVLEFREEAWHDIHPAKGFLTRFARPRDLAPSVADLLREPA